MKISWFQLAVVLCPLFYLTGNVPSAFSQQVPAGRTEHTPPAYRISAGDKLSIRFFSNPELNETAMLVRPDGIINPQLISEVRAAGRTVAELKAELERAYNEILLSPLITVSVVDLVPARIFVGGQVSRAGKFELREARTVVQAVFMAGGFTEQARRTMVIHARPKADGDWDIQVVNVLKIIEGKSSEKDIDLRDGDYVFVPNSRISQITKAIEAFRGFLPRFL